MKYFLDTEFHEYHKQTRVAGIKIGKEIPTIDLISIGIVSETSTEQRTSTKLNEPKSILHLGREYYAICKDFNIKNAWNSYQIDSFDRMGHLYFVPKKVYWLRRNVLKPIFKELLQRKYPSRLIPVHLKEDIKFTYKNFKSLINEYGKTREQIAEEIKIFVTKDTHIANSTGKLRTNTTHENVEFYAYYADYDWVVLAQLFGKMIDLPKGFPWYCNDLKQTLDEKAYDFVDPKGIYKNASFDRRLELVKSLPTYPKQENEHNALADAKWNKELYEFLNNEL